MTQVAGLVRQLIAELKILEQINKEDLYGFLAKPVRGKSEHYTRRGTSLNK
jgi:hypothetical protein